MRLLIVSKSWRGVCHQGLGISALNVQKVLKIQHGLDVIIEPVATPEDVLRAVDKHDPTHVQISAPWIPTPKLFEFVNLHQGIEWCVCYHSNIGFLAADPTATQQLLELSDLQRGSHNFRLASNSRALDGWVNAVLNPESIYLPNLYYLANQGTRFPRHAPGLRPSSCGTLRVGSFGAQRPLKNHLTAAAAALLVARQLGVTIEFHCNVGRNEGSDAQSLERLFHDSMPGVILKKVPWQPWPMFHRLVGQMHLCIQVSHSESFNLVTADAASQYVPSVVGPAITWAPSHWHTEPDDVHRVAAKAIELLTNAHAGLDGHEALQAHNAASVPRWLDYLGVGRRS